MLGLPINVSVDVKIPKSPFYFEHKNECVHCGSVGTLEFVDAFGNRSTKENVNAFEHIKCRNCGRIYSMKWEPTKEDSRIYKPSAVDFDVKRDFKNLVNFNAYNSGKKSLD